MLKSINVIIVLALSFHLASGQMETGQLFLSGCSGIEFDQSNAKYKVGETQEDVLKYLGLEAKPGFGVFVARNFAIGINLSAIYEKASYSIFEENDLVENNTMFTVSPFARYYFGKGTLRPYLHAEGGGGQVILETNNRTEGNEKTDNEFYYTWMYELGGGMGIFLGKRVMLDLGVGFRNDLEINNNEKGNASPTEKFIIQGIKSRVGLVFFFL